VSERTLRIQFVLDESTVLSPSDFVNFFAYGEQLSRALTEIEALDLFEYLRVPSEWQIDSVEQLRDMLKHTPAPAEIVEVNHDSPWHYLLAIPASTLFYFVGKCIHPEIRRAWTQSAARDHFFEFMRDRIFAGARQKVQRQVSRRPSRKGVRAHSVRELGGSQEGSPLLEVRMQRTEVFEVRVSDEELLTEFTDRLKE
jgi:hypothetical protein